MNRLPAFRPSALTSAYPPCIPKLTRLAATRNLSNGLRPSLPVVSPTVARAQSSQPESWKFTPRQLNYPFDSAGYSNETVALKVSSTDSADFAPFWLRDNCQCSKCIHPDTRQRSVNTFSIPTNVTAKHVEYDGEVAKVQWSDGHDGVYPWAWLRAHTMIRHSAQKQLPVKSFRHFLPYNPGKSAYPTVLYDKVMSSDEGVLDWLQNIYLFGFSFVKGVPIDPESTKTLLERIAFIRHTHYGGFWDFTADLTFKDTAYTTEFLGAHTDNTYFTDPARLQLFHLLSHTDGDGGASLLVDGFKAASVLKKENPVNYATLVNTFQPYHASGNDGTCIQPAEQAPVFKNHPSFRTLYQIRWNNYDRAAKRDWSTEEQNRWYNAARHFDNIITRKSMQLWTQLEPGTALIFDNWRMLHGRSEFTGKRRMCGGYVNNDDFISRYRLLRFGRDKVLDNLGNYAATASNPNFFI
ncbi:hypothetical protein ETB97_008768 [Aspergillus alliaceus]|uniref:Trimethyllysine dioxygenase n=1 Tax=Petromyces alliaceus TaxID=209559 RepID=A0A8H6E960_PETAA|nr:hypothetical protein ETB97_008768 [Aspergillus burnettii]